VANGIWTQDHYRIRRVILAIANQYYIENEAGEVLGYSRQKLLRLKDDIRIYSDDGMSVELFKILQDQIIDEWGTFSVIDELGTVLGKIRRQFSSSFVNIEYQLLDAEGHQYGRLVEEVNRGLFRKLVPFGGLLPAQIWVELFGQRVMEIVQQFKIIGDVWEVDCRRMPPSLDRRTLLSAMILLAIVEGEQRHAAAARDSSSH